MKKSFSTILFACAIALASNVPAAQAGRQIFPSLPASRVYVAPHQYPTSQPQRTYAHPPMVPHFAVPNRSHGGSVRQPSGSIRQYGTRGGTGGVIVVPDGEEGVVDSYELPEPDSYRPTLSAIPRVEFIPIGKGNKGPPLNWQNFIARLDSKGYAAGGDPDSTADWMTKTGNTAEDPVEGSE